MIKKGLILLSTMVGFLVLTSVWYVTRFDLAITSPITTETFALEYKEKKSLVPKHFDVGDPKQKVEAKLKRQGFGTPKYRNKDKFYMFDLAENEVAYENRYGSLLCDNSAGVIITYENENLVEAVAVFPGSSCA